MNREIKFIRHKTKWLKVTAKDIMSCYRKTKIELLEELGLELRGLVEEIEYALERLEKTLKKNGR